jgi:hypothetical protein
VMGSGQTWQLCAGPPLEVFRNHLALSCPNDVTRLDIFSHLEVKQALKNVVTSSRSRAS